MEDNEESPASLEAIGVREHAALVGLLAERTELIVRGALYVVHGVPPENVARILDIDSGIIWIAAAERLAGDIAAAEDALRAAIWAHMRAHRIDPAGRGLADIDLEVARMLVDIWRRNPSNWMTQAISAACAYLHHPVKAGDAGDIQMVGDIGGDIWRLCAGTRSVLGKPTSRSWFGDPLV